MEKPNSSDVIEGPRAVTAAELPEVIAVVNSALRAGSDQSMVTDYPLVFRAENLENIRILKVNREVAAEVPFIAWKVRAEDSEFSFGYISPTATAAKHRKKGYGLLCLMDCVKRMNQLGCELSMLSTQIATFPFYECGDYQPVQKQGWTYLCDKSDAGRFADNGEEIALYDPATRRHLAAIQVMHERDTLGVRRTAEAYASVFNLPKMKTRLAFRNGQPVGYAIVSRATNKPGLVEAGGDESAV
jgi:predicted acetyltransferase